MLRQTLFASIFLSLSLIVAIVFKDYFYQKELLENSPTPLAIEFAKVTSVIDGDTIELEDGRVVRYIGIDTPEKNSPFTGKQCFGDEASTRNEELVAEQTVRLEIDTSQEDKYGRLLRYVWIDDVLVNKKLVEEGYALAKKYPPDTKRHEELEIAQTQARSMGLGLWSNCPTRVNEEGTYFVIEDEEQDYQPDASEDNRECKIKGNISENGQLYHLQNCPSYRKVLINEKKGERWFCTEEEAVEAGWTKSSNCP